MKRFWVLGLLISLALVAAAGAVIGCDDGPESTDYCAPGCQWLMTWDETCQTACNNVDCNWDNGRCSNPIITPGTSSCVCAGMSNEWDAESCVWSYILTDAATTYSGKQLQASIADLLEDAYHGSCQKYSDGGWKVNTYFYWVDDTLSVNIFTEISLCGPNNNEGYNTEWIITPSGCVQAANGNAMRLLLALQS